MENQFSFERFNLQGNPFAQAAVAGPPYLSSSFRDALAAAYYGLEYGSRILIVSAARGTGKTTLLRYLERRLRDRGPTLLLSLAHENGREVLARVLSETGATATSGDPLIVRAQVDATLAQIAKAGEPFILLLDYSEEGTGSTLDVLRNFATLESLEAGLLRVVVASSPEVAEELRVSDLTYEIITLSRLTASEVANYIDHRLRLVGWNGIPLFTSRAYALIAEKSSGRPLRIDDICFRLLQNLSDLNGAVARPLQEGLLNESSVELLMSGRKFAGDRFFGAARVTPLTLLRNLWAAVLASIVLVLVVAIAALWYLSARKARAARHVAAISPGSTTRPQQAAFHGEAHGQLRVPGSTPMRADARDAKSTIAGGSGQAKTASRSAPDEKPAWPSSIESRAAAATASPRTATTPTLDRTTVSGQSAKSSSVPPPRALAFAPAVPNEPAPEVTNNGRRSANQMAASEIKLGDAYMNLGDYKNARSSFSRALALAPGSEEALDKMRRANRARAAEESVLR